MNAKPKKYIWRYPQGYRRETEKLAVVKETDCFFWIDGPRLTKVDKRSPFQMKSLFASEQDAVDAKKKYEREQQRIRLQRVKEQIRCNEQAIKRLKREAAKIAKGIG